MRGLAGGIAEAALADVDPARARRELAQRRVGEGVEQHDLGARARRCAPRTVIRSAAPGPAPMKTTGFMMRTALDQQRAAGAVAGGVDHDQRAADAVVGIALQRQRLLQFDRHLADLVDRELVRIGGREGVDVQHMLDRR